MTETMSTQAKTTRITVKLLLAAAAAVAVGLGSGASPASASTYTATECADGGHAAHPDLVFVEPNSVQPKYTPLDFCDTGFRIYSISNIGNAQQGEYANHFYDAPAGTVIRRAVIDVALSESDGYKPVLFEKRVGQPQRQLYKGSLSLRTHDSGWHDQDYVGVGIFCGRASGCGQNQGSNEKATAASGRATFYMRDSSAPTANPLSGSLSGGDWKRGGGHSIGLSGSDVGAGLEWTGVSVNGSIVHLQDHCNPTQSDGATTSMAPCPGSRSISKGGLSTAAAPFHEGINTVSGCVTEFGDSAASGCRTISVKVDNVAPPAPSGLQVAQGSGWQRVNDFDLSWNNPNQEHAPIDGAYVKVSGPGGTVEQFHAGANRQSLNNLQVPGDVPGVYTVEVRLRDAAGNSSGSNAVSATVKFDNVAPEDSAPDIANGWLGKAELAGGYPQDWFPPATPHPVSGIKGYAFEVDQAASTDPCDVAGSGGGAVECSDSEVDFQGLDNRSTTLQADDLAQGNNWVHVVPVSGARVKAEEIKHTRLQVDTVDPTATLAGNPSGWSQGAVTLTANGSDDRSGMVDTDEYPGDDPPATFLEINGATSSEPDAEVSGQVSGDGIHTVRFWARDLAGNTAARQTAQVRIDGTKPTAYFEPSDRDDPERLVAHVSDQLSGIEEARLHYREGNGEWVEIPSERNGNRLSGRMDSLRMKDGATYLFRVTATDAAGNETQSTTLADGTKLIQKGPFRDGTEITGLALGGKSRALKVPYGSRPELSGRLLDEHGDAVAGASVAITEAYDAGSKFGRVSTEVRTDGRGVFSLTLRRGPSRSVSAAFSGDRRRLGSDAGRPRLRVGGRVKLSVTKRKVGAGKMTRFKGRVGRRGANIPAGGKLVEIQVRVGRRWKALEKAIRTDRKGRYRLRYRFGRFYTEPTRFRFRARVLKEAGFPYRPARSKPKTVTVMP